MSGLDGYAGYSVALFQMLKKGGQKILDSAKARAQANRLDPEVVMFDNFAGRVSDSVVGEAAKWRADLTVLGTHGRRASSGSSWAAMRNGSFARHRCAGASCAR